MNYIVIYAYSVGYGNDVRWFDNYEEAAAFQPHMGRVLQIVSTTDNKHY